ncbi:hypothetical protein [Acinetobacter modestus]|uniref:hypothetical protein n=1 Tax=Acinetobacter modestus TaxID=1776740 RepID=UPI001F4AA29B|nr:hypothetical protein [Acinetobacter modestus]MCH7334671.1 hypothetical protein [Acinetobacter modestus]
MSSTQSAKLINSLEETNNLIEIFLAKFEDEYSDNEDYKILQRFLNAKPKYISDFLRSEELLDSKIFFESIYNDMTVIERNIVQLYRGEDGIKIPEILEKMVENVKKISSIEKDLLMMHVTNARIEESVATFICGEKIRRDKETGEYLEKIDILIFIENILCGLKIKLDSDSINPINNYRGYLNEVLPYFDDKKVFSGLLLKDLNDLKDIKERIVTANIDDLIDNEKLVEVFTDFKESLRKIRNSIEDNILKDDVYHLASRLYDIERRYIHRKHENDKLKSKIDSILIINNEITDKNEFFNQMIENLLKIEEGFHNLLQRFNSLNEAEFLRKDWEQIVAAKENIYYIINSFKNKNIYQFFLLFDKSFLHEIAIFVTELKIAGINVEITDSLALGLIKNFHEKTVDPGKFILDDREKWNTPYFWFNVNHYTVLKDYNIKLNKIIDADKRIDEYIEENGEFKEKYELYIDNIDGKSKEAIKTVSDLVCKYNQVSSALYNVENSEKFIKEIEGLYINNETRKIYEGVFISEAKVANRFRIVALIIYSILGLFALFSLTLLILGIPDSEIYKRVSDPQTLFIKIPFILTLLFIGVYLSREGEKHRRFANQARQTMNELHAFSSYSTDIKEKVSEIKTKLADKYFGVNLYETEKAMTPDSDVFKTLVEQTKATTDLVKTLKSSITPTVPESKEKKEKKENEEG